jgi:hypothetical protein
MAAALKSPSLRYRSFRNEPVRGVPSQSLDNARQSYPLIGAALEAAVAAVKPAPPAAALPAALVPPPSFVPLPADFAGQPPPGPVDLSYPLPESAPPSLAGASRRPASAMAAPPAASAGTLATLLHDMAEGLARPGCPAPQSGLLPAGMVTLPLAEVMRLVSGAVPDPASPFAALRLAGGPPGAR